MHTSFVPSAAVASLVGNKPSNRPPNATAGSRANPPTSRASTIPFKRISSSLPLGAPYSPGIPRRLRTAAATIQTSLRRSQEFPSRFPHATAPPGRRRHPVNVVRSERATVGHRGTPGRPWEVPPAWLGSPSPSHGGPGLRVPRAPSEDQPVHHLRELAQIATLLGDVGGGQVLVHHAVAEAPGVGALGVQPHDVLRLVVKVAQAPGAGIVVVVARIPEHEDRGLVVHGREVVAPELVEGVSRRTGTTRWRRARGRRRARG